MGLGSMPVGDFVGGIAVGTVCGPREGKRRCYSIVVSPLP